MEKALPKLQAKYDKAIVREQGLVGKAKEDEVTTKNLSLEDTSDIKYHPAIV